jgi:hypothetical protein
LDKMCSHHLPHCPSLCSFNLVGECKYLFIKRNKKLRNCEMPHKYDRYIFTLKRKWVSYHTWTVGSDEVSLLLYAAMKQLRSSSGIKSLNGSHAADLKLKLFTQKSGTST